MSGQVEGQHPWEVRERCLQELGHELDSESGPGFRKVRMICHVKWKLLDVRERF